MNLRVGVTDNDWFRFLAGLADVDEVNFWQPSGSRQFRALRPGEPFLFKLHQPENFIVGGGIFEHFSLCPINLAWEAFGEKNGVGTLAGMRARVARYRRVTPDPRENYVIGCIALRDPVFLPRKAWIPAPADFARNVVQGKTYDASHGIGRELWEWFRSVLQAYAAPQVAAETDTPMWSEPRLQRQRLGQGGFRLLITDTYRRRCAITGEKALPVLQAAHIRPVKDQGRHRVDNGLLLRSDVHTLFDEGYLTITPAHQVRVSEHLKKDFDNGEHYYQLDKSPIWLPKRPGDRPGREFLEWHADTVFRA